MERLRQHGCAHLLVAYASQIRDRWIDSPEQKKLENVLYRGLPLVAYELWHLERAARARAKEEGCWRDHFARIRELTGIFDDARSFARIPLARLIRVQASDLTAADRLVHRLARQPSMLIHLVPRFMPCPASGPHVQLIDLRIDSVGLLLRDRVDLATRRPMPNKRMAISCSKRGRMARVGLLLDMLRPAKPFSVVYRWAVAAEQLIVHRAL